MIFECYSSEKLITLNILHEVVPTWYSFTTDSTEAMRIKCLAQGNNILLPRFEPSTSVSRNRHSSQSTNLLIIRNYCNPIHKANILNRQFISVITDDTKALLPDLEPSQYLSMENRTVSCEGVVKLLKNLKPHKAARPDDIPLMLLKEAAD